MILNRQTFEYKEKTLFERVTIKPPFRYEAIFQNEGCFIYVKGSNSSILSASNKEEIKENEAVLLKCGTYFVDWLKKTNNNIEVIAIHLYPEILKKLYKKELPQLLKKTKNRTSIQKIIPENTISKFIESLEFYFQNPDLVNDDLLELKIKELILLLVQTKNATSVLELIHDLYSPRISTLKQVIDVHLFANLSVEELAKLCNLSLSSFKRAFHNVYKDSPKHYINTQKIKKAIELLVVSNSSISEISYQVGFNDPLYFTRIFKKHKEMSPSVFRNKFKQMNL